MPKGKAWEEFQKGFNRGLADEPAKKKASEVLMDMSDSAMSVAEKLGLTEKKKKKKQDEE